MSVYEKCKKLDNDIKEFDRQLGVAYDEFNIRSDEYNKERGKFEVPPNEELLKRLLAAANEKSAEIRKIGANRWEAFNKWMDCLERNISN